MTRKINLEGQSQGKTTPQTKLKLGSSLHKKQNLVQKPLP
jgi:hypothetical protein